MSEAIRLAEEGMTRGHGGPFGAVVVRRGKIVARGWNRVLVDNDPTAHAEITAIRKACKVLGKYHLDDCVLYISCEPCPMCLAAIHWARIGEIIFAANRKDAGAIGFIDDDLYRELCLPVEKRSLKVRHEGRETAVSIMQQWLELGQGHEY